MIPGKPNSLYEIGYMLQGRKAVFLVGFIQFIHSFGLMLIYNIVFSDTAAQLVGGFCTPPVLLGEAWYTSRWFYVLLLAVGMFPIIVKKEIDELEWLATSLGIAIVVFLLMCTILLIVPSFPATPPSIDEFLWPEVKLTTIQKVSTIMVAYAYQQNVFPIYSALKDKSIGGYAASSKRAFLFAICAYYIVALLGIFLFGLNIKSSILLNFGDPEYFDPNTGKPYWESTIIQISFMIVLLAHIPFIFFPGKEGLCILVDEYQRQSISNVLWHKLQSIQEFSELTKHEAAPNPEIKLPLEIEFENSKQTDPKASMIDVKKSVVNALSIVPQNQANRLAYKDMKAEYYYLCVFGYYIVAIVVSILVPDITVVFSFVSAFAVSAIGYWCPGFYYLAALEKFGQKIDREPRWICVAKTLAGIGFVNCALGLFSAIFSIVGGGGGGH